jgi:hypothetical protein
VWTYPDPVIQLAATHMAGAKIAGGPMGGRYAAADKDLVWVATRMHVRAFGITSIALINGNVIKTLAELLANFRAAQAALESESGTSPGREVPPPTRPSDENTAEMSRTKNSRSLVSRDEVTSCAYTTANFFSDGGSFPFLLREHRYEMPPHRCPPGVEDQIR